MERLETSAKITAQVTVQIESVNKKAQSKNEKMTKINRNSRNTKARIRADERIKSRGRSSSASMK